MPTLEHLDVILGEALEDIVKASDVSRQIDALDPKETLKHLGMAISELWHVRESVYHLKPELKRDFVREREENKPRYEQLSELRDRAYQAERSSDTETASRLYRELKRTSRFGYFRILAEAGLFRLSRSARDFAHPDDAPGEQGAPK